MVGRIRWLPLLVLGLWTCADLEWTENETCEPASYKCVGANALKCLPDGSGWEVGADCATSGKICTSRGCLACEPNALQCQGQSLLRCKGDGSGFLEQAVLTCDSSRGETCEGQRCTNACDLARANRSYVGCEYWAVDLDNAVVSTGNAAAQQYAVVLSNPSSLTATVRVLINEARYGEPARVKEVTSRTVKPNELQVVLLPPREVDGSPDGEFNTGSGTAVTSHAYKIESTAPLIAYQFNPLSNVGVFSNDASLLVPTSALSVDSANQLGSGYMVMSWPATIATTTNTRTNFGEDLRGFLTIVGTRPNTHVEVRVSTDTLADATGLVRAHKKGETLRLTLNPFDVLNLETKGFRADFTGSSIDTDKPIAVFSGSEASDAPDFADLSLRKCCADHLEEQLFPLSTLGTTHIALTTPPRTRALHEAGAVISEKEEKEVFRILAADKATHVTTNLPQPDDRLSLERGAFAQLRVAQDFTIRADEAVVVGQFITSQEDAGVPSTLPGGDPSFILLPPVEQFRKDYLFLTPDKYAFDFIMVAAPRHATVALDNRPLKEGCDSTTGRKLCCTRSEVGPVRVPGETTDTPFVALKCQLSFPQIDATKLPPDNLLPGEQNDGVHRLSSSAKVGLVVCGFDAFVSYGYPGGTDLALINVK